LRNFKDNQNRFNGILMGDLRPAFGIGKETGLFGFHEGVESFGWKVDGTGFIGKKGHGQILFDGNKGIIKSGIYQQGLRGMEIDLDGSDGNSSSFKAYGPGGKFELNTIGNGTPLLSIKDTLNRQMMYIDSGKYYLQSANYSEGTWGSGMHINLSNGDIRAKDFHLRINIDNERKIVLDSADETPLQIGDRAFSVDYRGKTVFNVNPPYNSSTYVNYKQQGLFTKANSIVFSPDAQLDVFWPKEDVSLLESSEREGGIDINGGGKIISLSAMSNIMKTILDNAGANSVPHGEYNGEGDIFQVANWGVNIMGWNFNTRGIFSGNGAHYIRNAGGIRFLTDNMKLFLSENTFLVGKKLGDNITSTPRLVVDNNGIFMTIRESGINDSIRLSAFGRRQIQLTSSEIGLTGRTSIKAKTPGFMELEGGGASIKMNQDISMKGNLTGIEGKAITLTAFNTLNLNAKEIYVNDAKAISATATASHKTRTIIQQITVTQVIPPKGPAPPPSRSGPQVISDKTTVDWSSTLRFHNGLLVGAS